MAGQHPDHVRKHRAPKGALRLAGINSCHVYSPSCVRKHRAPKGALRRGGDFPAAILKNFCQKAPSTKRCIKTSKRWARAACPPCQKAPSAKRCIKTHRERASASNRYSTVRKHRAPKGALRPLIGLSVDVSENGQKAPSAKRCIKTPRRQTGRPRR